MNHGHDCVSTHNIIRPALYVVATPIGNMEDITLRAISTLKSVDFIACEDTRTTAKLLNKFGIIKQKVAYHRFNEEKKSQEIIEKLKTPSSCALVSESGTPAISDPGARLIEKTISAGIPVFAIPGPSAVTSAFSICGWEGGFLFAGFLEKQKKKRISQIETFASMPWAVIFFESPLRIRDTLKDMEEILGDRPAFLAKELTKVFEFSIKASPKEILEKLPQQVKGEIVVIIFPSSKNIQKDSNLLFSSEKLLDAIRAYKELTDAGLKPSRAAAIISRLTGIEKDKIIKSIISNNSTHRG